MKTLFPALQRLALYATLALANVGMAYAQDENYFLENYFWGGILITIVCGQTL